MIELNFTALDTETTGLHPETDRIVEIALVGIREPGESYVDLNSLVNPQRLIPMEAQAVHHITDADVATARTLADLEPQIRAVLGDTVIVAHHAPFDRGFIMAAMKLTNPWVCSCRLARHMWPEAPGHSNIALREWLKLDVDTQGQAAHRAYADALVTAALFRHELAIYQERNPGATLQNLIDYCWSPINYLRMPFGKHRGVLLKDMPADYVRWMLGNLRDLDPDLRACLRSAHGNTTS